MSGGVAAAVQSDAWLSEVMGRPVFRVAAASDAPEAPLETAVRAHEVHHGSAFYYGKVPSTSVDLVRRLSSVGFFAADVNVTLELRRPSGELQASPGVQVRVFESSDEAPILDIASSTFRFTRFHLDPLVSDEVANRVKREWVRNYCVGHRGDRLFVALHEGRTVGFLAALAVVVGSVPTAVIDLVGVAPDCQRVGAGSALTRAFIEHYRASHESLLVGTQVANVPSIRMYERMGFAFAKSEYVLHKHVGE